MGRLLTAVRAYGNGVMKALIDWICNDPLNGIESAYRKGLPKSLLGATAFSAPNWLMAA
jgi:hypothetical protein